VAGNACVSATRWNRIATVATSVLRRTPGGPHLPPGPLPLPVGERKGERAAWGERRSPTRHAQRLALPARQGKRAADGGTERWPPNAVVARARYVPNKKSGFLFMLLFLP
jgi:hypothetical protein